ncbi:aliphatic sulfonate ABC transporter substrate-binding protein [Peribacillus frigoritolerans]|uniref:Putative aliphatic sulfonates-binding protein n=1 Tax=Peribacillus frigoritolerans TaxID=450367 RepID=A0AAJ1V9J8_9BACI|nr:aliphatic sulfonate ABC transporter substrate-binding protein [Peribacillus frigoritolerans]MDM5281907.1 aliphatic sulfonate ABC transporter substrate-binding protein [Peribacillus frigoritolerans]
MNHVNQGKSYLLLISLLILALFLTACGKAAGTVGNNKEINIGYQKNGTSLTLKNKQALQKDLEKEGYKVKWSEFNTGSSILEALNAGSIDFAGAGDIPSIFALAKGSDFKFIASEPSSPSSQGILVGKDSQIKSLEDLKGKKVAFNKASISQYLLNQSLDSVGLAMSDVEPVYLNPPDASVAFEQGEVDAWVVWDPYMTVSESKGNTILKNKDGVPYRTFYFSSSKLANEHPEIVGKFVEHLADAGKEIDQNPTKAAALLQKETNIPKKTWEKVLNRKTSDVNFIDEEAVQDLQAQADILLKIGLTEKAVNIDDYVWNPKDK